MSSQMTQPGAAAPAISEEDKRRRAIVTARIVYALVFFSFISLCVIAVTVTMAMEKDKPGFQQIKVEKPISYFDRTYMDDKSDAEKKPH
jgi:hypothetical protein